MNKPSVPDRADCGNLNWTQMIRNDLSMGGDGARCDKMTTWRPAGGSLKMNKKQK